MSKKRTKVATISILLILGTLTAIYLGYKNDIFTKEVINLVCSENKISWYIKDDMDLKDGYFVLYRNGIEVYKGDKTEYTDNPVEDYEAPEDVKSININYEIDKIILDWDAALDKGSDNRFKVYFVNRNGIKILRSNENTYNYSSGISKYIVNIGESTFETDSNKLEVNREDLGSGVLDTSVIALDNRGNKGTPVELDSIRNFSLDVVDKDGKLSIINHDKEQDYTYKIYINNEEIAIDGNSIDYKDIFTDTAPLKTPIPKRQLDVGKDLLFYWDSIEVSGTAYEYYIEGLGSKYNNNVYSNEFEKVPELKGYYYAVNKDKSYEVSNKDVFLDSNIYDNVVMIFDRKEVESWYTEDEIVEIEGIVEIDMSSDEGIYYFHIASADNLSNISETFSYKFNEISKSKFDIAESFFIIEEIFGLTKYELERKHLALLPDNIINFIKSHSLKIYLGEYDLGYIYDIKTGKKTENKTAGYYYGDNNIIKIDNRNSYQEVVLHEVGHSVDYVASGYRWFSSKKDFVDIYNKEKDKLYSNKDYPRSEPKEYFAEAFSDYIKNPYNVKELAPLTYEYMDKLVNSIK